MDICYRHNFRYKRIPSVLLQNSEILDVLRSSNFVWIKPVSLSWEQTLRNPILGCVLELLSYQNQNFVHIDSVQGKKLIWNNCYRSKA